MNLSIAGGSRSYSIPLEASDLVSDEAFRQKLTDKAPDLGRTATTEAISQLRALLAGANAAALKGEYRLPAAALTSRDPDIAQRFSLRPPSAKGALQVAPDRDSMAVPSMPSSVEIEMEEFHPPRLEKSLVPDLTQQRDELRGIVAAHERSVASVEGELATCGREQGAARGALRDAIEALPGYDPLINDHGMGTLTKVERELGELQNAHATATEQLKELMAERATVAARYFRGGATEDRARLLALEESIETKHSALTSITKQLGQCRANLTQTIAELPGSSRAITEAKTATARLDARSEELTGRRSALQSELADAQRSLRVKETLLTHLPKVVRQENHSALETLGRLRDFNPYTTRGDSTVYRKALAALGNDDSLVKGLINGYEALKAAGATHEELAQFFTMAKVPNHWRPPAFVAEVQAFEELNALFAAEAAKKASAPAQPELAVPVKLASLIAKYGLSITDRQQRALVELVGCAKAEFDPNDRIQTKMHDEALLVGLARVGQAGLLGLSLFSDFFSELSSAVSLTESVVGAVKRHHAASSDSELASTSRERDDGYENALRQSMKREYQLMAKHVANGIYSSIGLASVAASPEPTTALILKGVKYSIKGLSIAGQQIYDWSVASTAKELLTRAMAGDNGAKVELFAHSTKYAKGLLALGATKGDSTAMAYLASRGLTEQDVESSSFTVIRAFLLEAAEETDEQQTFGELYRDVSSSVKSAVRSAAQKVASLKQSSPQQPELELEDLSHPRE